jgi:kynurenine formamidase
VPAGEYQLICLPLLITGLDGAPARAVLVADSDGAADTASAP